MGDDLESRETEWQKSHKYSSAEFCLKKKKRWGGQELQQNPEGGK